MDNSTRNRNKATPKKASATKKPARQSGLNPKSGRPSGLGPIRSAPLTQARVMTTGHPQVSGSPYKGDGRTVVKHREYVKDINGSVAFSAESLSINPGLATLYTWLSNIAANYESYRFLSLEFLYETQRSASTDGRLALAVDFDAADATPANKTEMMSFQNASSSGVWEECVYKCDRKDLDKFGIQRFVRQGTLASNLDIKTYDIGNLIVATQGCANANAIGELYVEYVVELLTPQFSLASQLNSLSAKIVGGGTVSGSAYLGTVPVITGGLPVSAVTNTITFNKVGQYIVQTEVRGTVMLEGALTPTGTTTSSQLSSNGITLRDTGNLMNSAVWRVTVNNIGETFILSWAGVCTTTTSSQVRIAPYLYSLN